MNVDKRKYSMDVFSFLSRTLSKNFCCRRFDIFQVLVKRDLCQCWIAAVPRPPRSGLPESVVCVGRKVSVFLYVLYTSITVKSRDHVSYPHLSRKVEIMYHTLSYREKQRSCIISSFNVKSRDHVSNPHLPLKVESMYHILISPEK